MKLKSLAIAAAMVFGASASFGQASLSFSASVQGSDSYTVYLAQHQFMQPGVSDIGGNVGGPLFPGSSMLPASTPSSSPYYLIVSVTNSAAPSDFTAWLSGTATLTGSGWQFANGSNTLSTADTKAWVVDYQGALGTLAGTGGVFGASNGVQLQATSQILPGVASFSAAPSDAIWNVSNVPNAFNSLPDQKVVFATQISAVPEPSAYALAFAGLGLVGVMARRRKTRLGA